MKKENKAKKMEEKQRLGVHMKVAHVTVIVIIFLANDILFLIFFFLMQLFSFEFEALDPLIKEEVSKRSVNI